MFLILFPMHHSPNIRIDVAHFNAITVDILILFYIRYILDGDREELRYIRTELASLRHHSELNSSTSSAGSGTEETKTSSTPKIRT